MARRVFMQLSDDKLDLIRVPDPKGIAFRDLLGLLVKLDVVNADVTIILKSGQTGTLQYTK
jgi:hypothetical protein